MNILMLGRWVPPPRHPVRTTREYQFARRLARSHRLTLGFITDHPDASGSISALRSEFGDLEFAAVPRGWKSLTSALRLATGESCALSYSRSEALRTRLVDRLKTTSYGLILVTSSNMIQYTQDIDSTIPLVIDFGDLDSEWWVAQADLGTFPGGRFFRSEAARLRAAEAAGARRAAACMAASEKAEVTIRKLAPEVSVTRVPNGIDLDSLGSAVRPGKVPTVVLSGSFGGPSEVESVKTFYRTMLPMVRTKVPDARFIVVGGERSAVADWVAELLGAEVVARVTDSRPFLHSTAVAAAPPGSGDGTRTNVLEAIAAGVPVVATATICAQLQSRPGQAVEVADDPLDFAHRVIQLLQSASLRRQVADRGRRFAETTYSWDVYAERVREVIDKVLAGGGRTGSSKVTNDVAALLKR